MRIPLLILAAAAIALGATAEDAAKTPAPSNWPKWEQLASIAVGHGYLTDNDVSPDGSLALVVSEEEALIRVYDLKTLKPIDHYTFPGFEKFGHVAALFWPTPSDSPSFVCGGDQVFALHDAKTGKPLQAFGHGPVRRMRFSPDHSLLVCLQSTPDRPVSTLRFYRVQPPAALTELDALEIPDRVLDWDLSRGNDRLAIVTVSDQLRCAEWKSRKELWNIASPKYANAVSFSPDGATLACGGERLVLVDAATGAKSAACAAFKNNINTVAFAPSGDAVAVSSYDGRIRIIGTDIAQPTLPVLKELKHNGTANVYGITFFANGSRLLSTSGDKTVRIWGVPDKAAPAAGGGATPPARENMLQWAIRASGPIGG